MSAFHYPSSDSGHTGTLSPLGSPTEAEQPGAQQKAEVTGTPSFRSTERKHDSVVSLHCDLDTIFSYTREHDLVSTKIVTMTTVQNIEGDIFKAILTFFCF